MTVAAKLKRVITSEQTKLLNMFSDFISLDGT